MSREHPARLASQRSMDAVHKKDKQAWLANFADDAVVEDPIGVSALDPNGQGQRGKEAISKFWDAQIGPNKVMFNIRESFAAGDEVANVGTITVVMPNGLTTLVDGVFTYRVTASGRLVSLRAYWEVDKLKIFA